MCWLWGFSRAFNAVHPHQVPNCSGWIFTYTWLSMSLHFSLGGTRRSESTVTSASTQPCPLEHPRDQPPLHPLHRRLQELGTGDAIHQIPDVTQHHLGQAALGPIGRFSEWCREWGTTLTSTAPRPRSWSFIFSRVMVWVLNQLR